MYLPKITIKDGIASTVTSYHKTLMGAIYGAAMVVLLLCTAMYATAGVEETLHNWGHNKLSRQICMEKNYISIK